MSDSVVPNDMDDDPNSVDTRNDRRVLKALNNPVPVQPIKKTEVTSIRVYLRTSDPEELNLIKIMKSIPPGPMTQTVFRQAIINGITDAVLSVLPEDGRLGDLNKWQTRKLLGIATVEGQQRLPEKSSKSKKTPKTSKTPKAPTVHSKPEDAYIPNVPVSKKTGIEEKQPSERGSADLTAKQEAISPSVFVPNTVQDRKPASAPVFIAYPEDDVSPVKAKVQRPRMWDD
jgi:hypothetical protein